MTREDLKELLEELPEVQHSGPCFREWCCDACYWRRAYRAAVETMIVEVN